jgi:hypothetical protein
MDEPEVNIEDAGLPASEAHAKSQSGSESGSESESESEGEHEPEAEDEEMPRRSMLFFLMNA